MKQPVGSLQSRFVAAVLAVSSVAVATLFAAGPLTAPSQAAFPGLPGKIAFVRSTGMMQSNLFAVNPDGTGETPLTTGTGNNFAPTFSYDGQLIALVRPAPEQEIFVMQAVGGTATNITDNAVLDSAPSFFPDGRIAFGSTDGDDEIYVMNGDGSAQTNITNNDLIDRDPAVSPDGTKIAFERFDGSDLEIYVMNADGSNQVPLTSSPDGDTAAAWSPDGRRISWLRTDGVNVGILVMNADGSSQTPVAVSDDAETFPEFAPDNSRLVFKRSGANAGLYTLDLVGSVGVAPLTTTSSDTLPTWQPIPVNCGGRRATIVGTPGGDTLTGTPRADVISGQGGRDRISGLAGADRLCGDKGKDVLKGGPGKDWLIGGKASDRLIGGRARDVCVGGKGKDSGKGCDRGKL